MITVREQGVANLSYADGVRIDLSTDPYTIPAGQYVALAIDEGPYFKSSSQPTTNRTFQIGGEDIVTFFRECYWAPSDSVLRTTVSSLIPSSLGGSHSTGSDKHGYAYHAGIKISSFS